MESPTTTKEEEEEKGGGLRPGGAAGRGQRRQYQTHMFAHGDTLASINRLNKWSHVRAGQILYVRPTATTSAAAEDASSPAADVIAELAAGRKNASGLTHSASEADRRSQSMDIDPIGASRPKFGRGTLDDLSKSVGFLEEELLMKNAREPDLGRSTSQGGSLSRQRSPLLDGVVSQDSNSDVFREDCAKYSVGQDLVTGILVVTSWRFIFQPSSSDPIVQKNGFLNYQLNISIRDIYDCSEEVALSQYLSSEAYVQVSVKEKVEQSKDDSERKTVNGKILYFQLSRQRSQVLIQKLNSAMEIHKKTNALAHRKQQRINTSLPRRSMMVAKSVEQPADPKLHDGPSSLLLFDDIRAIHNMLPVRERSCDWKLLYSSQRHGVALSTLYNRVRDKGSTVVIVEDSMHYIFGAFCSDSWQVSDKYYGTGSSFLYKLYPKKAFYLWTGVNNYVQLSGEDFISVGGGSGTMGLWLNDDLSFGSSQSCDTFANEPLASAEEFSVLHVEVWGFVASEI